MSEGSGLRADCRFQQNRAFATTPCVVSWQGASLLVPGKGSNDADAAGAPKERPTGNGRFAMLASPPAGATNIAPQTTIKVGVQNGRIKRLAVVGPDGTPGHG